MAARTKQGLCFLFCVFLFACSAQQRRARNGEPGNADLAFSTKQPGALDFIAYGDMLFTSPKDTRNSNPRARRALIDRIVQEKPELLVITGDVVFTGEHAPDWQVFEAESKSLRNAGTTVFPVLGEHDLRNNPETALPNFFSHFPEIRQHRWYSVAAGPLFFIMLDSLSDESDSSEQGQWLKAELDHLPPEAEFVVLVFHHPCYTHASRNLLGLGHAVRPQEQLLASMLEERSRQIKAKMLVINGHAHNYERYDHGGIMYLVSAGGGARPVTVSRSGSDFYKEGGPTYHYIKFHVADHKLSAQMVKYEDVNGGAVWKLKDSFEIAK